LIIQNFLLIFTFITYHIVLFNKRIMLTGYKLTGLMQTELSKIVKNSEESQVFLLATKALLQ